VNKLFAMTIRRRLISIILTVTLCAVSILFVALAFLNARRAENALVRQTTLLAALIGQNSVVPLAFNDTNAAGTVLQGLHTVPSIRTAALYDQKDSLVAHFGRRADLPPFAIDDSRFHGNILVTSDIVRDQHLYGKVVLVASREGIRAEVVETVTISLIILAIVVAGAVFGALVLQKSVSRPILSVASVARSIARENNYNLRSPESGSGEIGQLQKNFNTMVDRLQETISKLEHEIAQHKHTAAQKEYLEERLRQSERLKALGRMAGGIAHDFNNQLVGIMGYASFLKNKLKEITSLEKTDRLIKYAEKILESSQQYSEIIKKLLVFSRQHSTEMSPVSLTEIIDEVVSVAAMSCTKNITFTTRFLSDTTELYGNKGMLYTMFLNLALNARDAMPDGGTCCFSLFPLHKKDPETGRSLPCGLRIEVSDTGVGMAEEVQKHIFDPFFTTKESGKGTGLGLASVYGIVSAHKGRISVTSRLGAGTTFTILFPVFTLGEHHNPKEVIHG